MDKETLRRKTLTLSTRWQYWVRLVIAADLSVFVVKKTNFLFLAEGKHNWVLAKMHVCSLAPDDNAREFIFLRLL
jgi:hypothetical protein